MSDVLFRYLLLKICFDKTVDPVVSRAGLAPVLLLRGS